MEASKNKEIFCINTNQGLLTAEKAYIQIHNTGN